ncbi:MAG TPA: succinate dehydrogenase cytochrome b subunit [Bacteroidales bacterium]|nr:succinate dehydrogenase cytochrome b subunit [Bacteroidales bacterium]HPS51795.1 succinate dehydrogenase cytochrome b subunit [Bacteroidales bacterium]
MNTSFLRFSSITKKIWMALLGIFLMIFLVIHLGINLCLLRSDGGEWFNAAAHFMGTNYIVKVFEVVLFGGFILHILIGILLQIQNWLSRPVRYKVSNRSYTPFLSKYMIYTGAIVLIFLILHFMNFYFIKLGWVSNPHVTVEGEPDFYLIARDLFLQPLYSFLYIVLIVILGFHLNHAFQAAWQTLGVNHPRYNNFISWFGTIYAILIPIGFIIIPVYFLFIR